ncbi:FCD domain-containing protein [Leucobacter sp. UCMA 4100]|uniref:FCD domain-containing protein n=1 Tax=Leucobacter sp. UCMA 4100 TaxID=2810534 RepID=UPI0022EAE84F|nr:FCD domain-containing protein [Leucobacter sp. UCMA 4100]MDA3146830.1 FCD domain-containing protein [Leucobacter sp. UCMA 4100]
MKAEAMVPAGSLLDRVRQLDPKPQSAEGRVIAYVLAAPDQAIMESAMRIGQESGVSDASVIRTANKLGYAGLRDMKHAIRDYLSNGKPVTEQRRSIRSVPPATVTNARIAQSDVHEELRRQILTGELASGVRVTEAELADRLGVSRTPIREAVRLLEQSQLIVRDHRGITVPVQTVDEMIEQYDAYILLNSALVRKACTNRKEGDLLAMRRINQEMRELTGDDQVIELLADGNRRFHAATWKASGDRTLISLVRFLSDQLDRWNGTTLTAPGRREESLQQHEDLTDAIDRREGDLAVAIISSHLHRARQIRQELYEL